MMHFHHKGDIEQGHAHEFDHVSFLSRGSIRMTVNGVEKEFVAPHMILVKKDLEHEIIALEDETILCCIHGLRDIDTGDILDANQIPYDDNPRFLPHKSI
jgi:quercetin dioxygenase-like cupin family protein